MLAEETRVPG